MIKITGFVPKPEFADYLTTAFDLIFKDDGAQKYVVDVKQATTDEIQALNQKYRGINQPTDVLSFPLYENITELPPHDAPIGDLVICPDMTGGTHLDLEECYIHGILHLLGYDHEKNKQIWDDVRKKIRARS